MKLVLKLSLKICLMLRLKRGIITHWSPHYPLLYEVTCEMDHVWFVSVDMIRLVMNIDNDTTNT